MIFERSPKPLLKKRPKKARKRVPKPKTDHAKRFRAVLDANPGMTRAELARTVGCSRAWVTKVLGIIG